MSIAHKLRQNAKNLIGKSLSKKFMIIESDDWGSIRMPSNKVYEKLKAADVNLGKGESARYNLTDTLASAEDLGALFETLRKFKDHKGNHPVLTAVSLVANPDFEKIKADNFSHYHYEPFTQTLKRYQRESALALWKEGVHEKLFIPEFHGREHLNVPVWLRMLQKGDQHTHLGFEAGCWGFLANTPYQIGYQASFDVELEDDLLFHQQAIESGLELFEEIHGYKASFFVPPNGPFNNSLEQYTALGGIKFIGASKVQQEPLGGGKYRKRYHWLGQKNKHNQRYLTRNAFFEPNAPGKDWVASCLEDIHYAFLWKKPAVISSHRTNFIGNLDENNRKLGLEKLAELLTAVLRKWPDVEFITSTELGNLIASGK
ncbi:polysaccharide (de)acetylase [Cyclobacteriaceae bacterium YHN15]|nr:polysaccharide (de)acetylase [Cyclobacteriaceae bacterium YHN15]